MSFLPANLSGSVTLELHRGIVSQHLRTKVPAVWIAPRKRPGKTIVPPRLVEYLLVLDWLDALFLTLASLNKPPDAP